MLIPDHLAASVPHVISDVVLSFLPNTFFLPGTAEAAELKHPEAISMKQHSIDQVEYAPPEDMNQGHPPAGL
jgi:hypothetical protein